MKEIIRILGVPMDLGQSRRGVDMGPSALRYAGLEARLELLGYDVRDMGNIIVPNREENTVEGTAQRLKAVTNVCEQIYKRGRAYVEQDELAIFLGGDHSMSIGTVAAAASLGEPIGLIWIDAHGDYNLPQTSPSGNIHGMPVAVLCGQGPDELVSIGKQNPVMNEVHIVQVGIRNLDPIERKRLSESGIHVYTMRHVDELGIAAVARKALEHLKHLKHIHVSLDMDSLDPTEAPGVGTPVPGGLTYREAHLLMEIFGDSGLVKTMDVVEINPIIDQKNKTSELAVELVASLLGSRIL